MDQFRGTTIVSVRRNGKVAIAGDGQVSMGNTVMKGNAQKVRRLAGGKVIAGFAGGTADAFTLFDPGFDTSGMVFVPSAGGISHNVAEFTEAADWEAGANVLLQGEDIAGAKTHADQIAAEKALTYIHGYDDPDIIAGQGTIALEMLAANPDLDTLVVPIGGGGLISVTPGVECRSRAISSVTFIPGN